MSVRVVLLLCMALCLGSCTGENAAVGPKQLSFKTTNRVLLQTVHDDPIGRVEDITEWNGRIVVVDRMGANAKVFDPDGSLLMTLGRPGSGPGEFRDPVSASITANSGLAILDAASLKVVLFDSTGAYRNEIGIDGMRFGEVDVVPEGFLISGRVAGRDGEQDSSAIHIFDASGTLRRSFGKQHVPENINEGSFNTIHSALVGNTAVLAAMSTNTIQLIDLGTGKERNAAVGSTAYQKPAWPQDRMSGPEEALKWSRDQQWIYKVLAVDSSRFLLKTATFADSSYTYVYLMGDTAGNTLATSAPVKLDVWPGAGGNAFGIALDDAGDTWLQRLELIVR